MSFTKKIIIFSMFFSSLQIAYGQFSLPNLDYDEFELVKNKEERIHTGVYSKNGKIRLEAHYPIAGSIQSYCDRSNVVYDSVYIYYGKEIMQITFNKNGGLTKMQWKPSGRLLLTEMYGKDNKLKKQFTQYTQLNKSNPAPPCSFSYISSYVGTSITMNEDGSIEASKDYDTGQVINGKSNSSPIHKELKRLKPIADEIVRNSYGKKFFEENIHLNYYLTGAYHENSRSNRRNDGLPNLSLSDAWFQNYPDSLSLSYADFTYDIIFSEEERYSIIRVRLDSNGELVEGIDKSMAVHNAITKGLLIQPAEEIASKAKVLELAVENGLVKDDENLQVSLIWKDSSVYSSKGELFYELIFNKTPKKVWGCTIFYFDKWLINPVSKEVDKSGEDQAGDCAQMSRRIEKDTNGKYGFKGESESEPLISFTYEYLQKDMSYFLIAKKEGNYGIIDHEENILLPFKYDYISWLQTKKRRFKKEFCQIRKDGLYGLATKEGVIIEELKYKSIKVEGEIIILADDKEEKKIDMRLQLQEK
jgi:hypothetical protein